MGKVSSSLPAPRVRHWFYLGGLVAAGLAAYASSLSAPFVMDDVEAIVSNPNVRILWPLTEAISAPELAQVAGRPTTSFASAT